MSRSLKKPYYTDQQRGGGGSKRRSKLAKRRANRAIRVASKKALEDETSDGADGKAYRKESCSWNIRDWSFYSKEPKARRK